MAPKTKRVTCSLSLSTHKALRIMAAESGVTIAKLAAHLLAVAVQR